MDQQLSKSFNEVLDLTAKVRSLQETTALQFEALEA